MDDGLLVLLAPQDEPATILIREDQATVLLAPAEQGPPGPSADIPVEEFAALSDGEQAVTPSRPVTSIVYVAVNGLLQSPQDSSVLNNTVTVSATCGIVEGDLLQVAYLTAE